MTKRLEIVHTGQTLFAQFGLKKVTTDDIARVGGFSKATIYRHYKNKAEIFDEVVRNEADQLVQAIRLAVARESRSIDKLRAHLQTRMGKIQELINFYRVTQDSWGDYWPSIATVRREFLAAETEIVRGIIDSGNRTGELQVRKVGLAAHTLVVALTSVEYHWALQEQDITLETYIEMMLEMIIYGIGKK